MEWNLFIIPLTMIFTQLIKTAPVDSRWLPWISVLLGGLLGALYGAVAAEMPAGLMRYIVEGIVYGASAAGIYDAGTAAINGRNWEEDK